MDVVEALPKSDVPQPLTAALFPTASPAAAGTVPVVDPGRFSRELTSFLEVVVPSAAGAVDGTLPIDLASAPQLSGPRVETGLPQSQLDLATTPSPEIPAGASLAAELTFFLNGFVTPVATEDVAPGNNLATDLVSAVPADEIETVESPSSLLAALAAAFNVTPTNGTSPQNPVTKEAAETNRNVTADRSASVSAIQAPPVELARFLSRPPLAPVAPITVESQPSPESAPVEVESDVAGETVARRDSLPPVVVPLNVVPPPAVIVPLETPTPPASTQPVEASVNVPVAIAPPVSRPLPRPVSPATPESSETVSEVDSTAAVTNTTGEATLTTDPESLAASNGSSKSANTRTIPTPTTTDAVEANPVSNAGNTGRQDVGAWNPNTERTSGAVAETQTATISPRDPQQFADRLGRHVLQAHDQGQQLSVRITPPDLGTILIEVRSSAQGLNVRFETASTAAQQLLVDQLPQLREALVQLGRPADRVDVIRTESGFGAGAGTDTGRSSQQTFAERREPALPRPPEPPTPRNLDREIPATATATPGRMQELNIRV